MALTASVFDQQRSIEERELSMLTEVVKTRVETDLVHHDNASFLAALLKSLHGGGDIGCGDNVGLRYVSVCCMNWASIERTLVRMADSITVAWKV